MAYNLADIPAVQVGEQIDRRAAAGDGGAWHLTSARQRWSRSTALMALAVFPLAVGLGTFAPSLVALILNDKWQAVAPLLTVLSVLSVVRPMGWGVNAYLASFSRTRPMMFLELLKLGAPVRLHRRVLVAGAGVDRHVGRDRVRRARRWSTIGVRHPHRSGSQPGRWSARSSGRWRRAA